MFTIRQTNPNHIGFPQLLAGSFSSRDDASAAIREHGGGGSFEIRDIGTPLKYAGEAPCRSLPDHGWVIESVCHRGTELYWHAKLETAERDFSLHPDWSEARLHPVAFVRENFAHYWQAQ